MEWGVVVAADARAEWLLPWWWGCYRKHQNQPVAFVDLGMSAAAKEWCRERGLWIPFQGDPDFVQPQEKITLRRQRVWQHIYGPTVWQARPSWFKKPLAMVMSPFPRTVWMDLDCEVCQAIDPILEGIEEGVLGAVRIAKKRYYNSGVIVYDQQAPLLKDWAEACIKENASFIGDESLLSKLVRTNRYRFKEIAPLYNWLMGCGYHPDIKIAHWASSWGKLYIETMGGIQGYKEKLLRGST